MNGIRVWNDWKWTMAAVGTSLVAFYVHYSAWYAGYKAQATGLLGFIILRSVLLLLAWLTVVAAFLAASGKETTVKTSGFTLLHLVVLILILPGCVGCFPLWPIVLVFLVAMFGSLLFARRAVLRLSWSPIVLRPGLAILLFVLTWYLSASVTQQAFLGLGARIEDTVGAEKLKAWAADVIAAHQEREDQHRLEPDQMPVFVNDLLGPTFQGVRSVGVEKHEEPCVALFVGASAFHFRILVCPSRAEPVPPRSWIMEVAEMEWRPGIILTTEGK